MVTANTNEKNNAKIKNENKNPQKIKKVAAKPPLEKEEVHVEIHEEILVGNKAHVWNVAKKIILGATIIFLLLW